MEGLIRDTSQNFLLFVNCQPLAMIEDAHKKLGCEYEINDGFVLGVLFRTDKDIVVKED